MSGNTTTGGLLVAVTPAFLEPVPLWSSLEEDVGAGWSAFTYGLGALFTLNSILTIASAIWFRQKLVRQGQAVIVMAGITWSGTCLSLFLLVDAYSRWRLFPVLLTGLLAQLYKPAMLASYISLQNILIHIGSVPVKSNKLQTPCRVVICTVMFSGIILATEVTLLFQPYWRLARVIPEVLFLLFSSYLCVCYIYSGFKLTNYIEDTKILDKLYTSRDKEVSDGKNKGVTCERKCRCTARSGVSKDDEFGMICRCRTRLKRGQTVSTYILDLNSDSSESDFDRLQKKHEHSCPPGLRQWCSNESDSCTLASSTHINKSFDPVCMSVSDSEGFVDDASRLLCASKIDESSVTSADVIVNYQAKTFIEHETKDHIPNRSGVEVTSLHDLKKSQTVPSEEENSDSKSVSSHDLIFDNGYLADAEAGCSRTRSNGHDDGDSIATSFFGKETKSFELPKKPPKTSSSFSLLRIRQCYILKKAVPTMYCATFVLIINTIFQLYSLFGVYGIFGSGKTPEPWPWFLFQLLHRSVELLFLIVLFVAIVLVLGHKPHRRNRNHRRSDASKMMN